MKKIIVPLLVAVVLSTCGCAGKNGKNELPDVMTHAINEDEKVVSSITISGFNISVYKTYAAVDGYSGDVTQLMSGGGDYFKDKLQSRYEVKLNEELIEELSFGRITVNN